ncbi:MAG TPA: PKD domain-containing protein, partial [Aggregatilineales bacterium]|nr:PKD domain-containing protein [Aggregatilineales bacterium]
MFLVFIFSFMLGSLVTSAQTGDAPTLPESTAEASDVQPTVIPTAEIVPSPTVWVEPTPDATPTAAPTVETPVSDTLLDTTPEVTVEVTVEADADRRPPPTGSGDPSDRLRRPQTYCEMSITDANDTNPFTFAFSAVNANNIASYAWTLGDGVGTSTAASFNYTYAGPGDYTITLICTPQPDSGAPITLEGQISITPTTLADFVLLPGQIFEDLPVTVTAQNTSIGDNLTYEWWINRSLDPNAGPFIYGSNASPITTEDISFEFTSAQVTAFPAEFYFHMRATAPGGIQSARSQSIVFNIASPNADFTLSPVSGPAPLTVTVTGVDLLAGPIDEWFWDLNGDFDPVARTGAEASGIGPHSFVFSTPDSLNTVTLHYRGPGLPANLFNSVTKSAYAADPGGPLFAAFSAELTGVVSGGLVQVCFTNESEGPIDFVEWDFNNDGTVELNSETDPTALNEVVCWFFAEQSEPYTVELTVGRLPRVPVIISQATRNVVVTAPPVASFNVSPGEQIEWGTRLNLTNTSTGVITSYAWDLDNDGQFDDSTAQNPSNLALSTIGANVITLKVTGPGGSSTAQKTIIVGVKPVTCDISGTFKVLPGAASQSYTATVNGLNVSGFPTRTITYTWQVLGTGNLPPVTTGSSINIDWASVGFGNYTLLLSGVTSDGAPCNATATVNHSYEPLVCNTNVSPSFSGYPDGRTYTLTASVSGLNGRAAPTAYRWYVNGVLDPSQTGATYSFTNTDDTTAVPTTFNIRYETDVNNDRPGVDYTPDTSSCDDTTTLNVGQWPDLSCNSIDGNATPLPITPDNPTRTYTYTAQLGNLAGRTNLSYAWTIPNTVSQSQSGNNVTVSWSNAAASLAPGSSNDNLAVLVTVTNPDGTTDTCSMNRNVNVRVPRLTCSISGDLFTVIGENEIYTSTRGNVYGRTISHAWTLTPVSPAGTPITGTGSTFNYTFLNADTLYTLSYTATAAADPVTGLVGDTCTSSPLNISTYGEGVNWSCESALTGSATPNNPASTYSYNLTVDNGNVPAVNLTYTYTLYDYLNNAYPLGSITRTTNGVVTSPAFTLAQLGPLGVDNYRLEVDVTDDDPATDLTCNRSLNLTVGTLTADFSYTAGIYTNSAVAINQAICLTNTTSAVPGDIDTPNYTWEILGVSGSNPAQTTLGPTTTFSGRDLTCFAFTQTGSYDVRLTAVTDSGLRTSTDTLRFNVYGLQGIQINRSGSSFGGTNQTLSAIGTNLFSGQYQWRIYTPASAGTPSYTSNQQNYTVNLPAGEYRAVVTGNGNLGQTSAEITFTLLPTDGLSARFVANRYAGPSGTEFCFTDRSVSGSPISLWEWDVDGDGAFEITSSTGSPNPCITLTGGGVSRAIRLRVTNSTFTDVATNIVRTYTLEESRNTFTITPQGNGAYCFSAVLVDGVSVTSWDFGDGTQMSTPALPGGTLNEVCHTYNVTGEFRVIMRITPPDGEIEKPVYPQIGATPPNLAVNVVCTGANNATPVFRITNTGGPLQSAIVYRYFDGNGNQIGNSGTFTLAGGTPSVPEVLTFTGPAYVGGLRFVTEGLAEAGTNLTAEIDLSSPCTVPPELTSSATCDAVTFLPSFTVTNEAPANGPMPDAYRWEIRDSSSILIASGTFQLDGDFDSVTASVPAGNNPYDTYTFTVYDENDVVVSALGQTRNCAPPPSLSISSTCAYPVAFTVSNSGGAMVMGQQYTVYDSANGIVQTGTLPAIAANSTATVELTGLDPYVYYRIETTGTGFLTGVSDESDCARPAFTVEQVCGFPLTFTVTNTGGQMLTTADYTITNTTESTQAQTGT